MVFRGNQAWLTCVTRDDRVKQSLVLAESLRKTRSTRKIGVIVSSKLSKDTQLLLQTAFDYVLLINDVFTLAVNDEEIRAKCFAFGLTVFDKCVFISPRSLALENPDKLFDENWDVAKDFSKTWDIFGFTPNPGFCHFLCQKENVENGSKFNLTKGLKGWLKQKKPNLNESTRIDANSGNEFPVWKFSLENGRLDVQGTNSCAPWLVNFTNVTGNDDSFISKLKNIGTKRTTGLIETTIIQEWLNILEKPVMSILNNNIDLTGLGNEQKHFNEPIAIIGMSCRFPGARDLDEFWELLHDGKEGICLPPSFRWTKEQTVSTNPPKWNKQEAGFLKDPVDEFDCKFFGVSPKDTETIDPQAKLLLEVVWESLENGGINPHSLYGSHTGIFTGTWQASYLELVQDRTGHDADFFRTYLGNGFGASAARLSHLLGLTGPCVASESACSSVIVANDLAVRSLRSGETNLAIVGGVNLLLRPFGSSTMEQVFAPDGRCKTFDESANGFGRAEGCGVLVLKRLSDALRDRNHIWALVRGSGVTQEGISNSIGTPTVHCESLAMTLAMKDAGVRPEQVSFVETHGTGTKVGDPLEVRAVAKAYHSKARTQPLIIGSVKTNVGHTESCSGFTGIIKTVLALKHEIIPEHLHLNQLNPKIDLESIPAKIPLEPIAWPKVKGKPRLAGVSSFGITGGDGHVIIEEAPDYQLPKFNTGLERSIHFMKISGKSNDALDELLLAYGEALMKLQKQKSVTFADAAYTANVGRASFENRAFLLAKSYQDAVSMLKANKVVRGNAPANSSEGRKICFLFTGQGSQYPGMAMLLYETSPVFRLHFDQCDFILRENYNLSLAPVLWECKSKELKRTIYSQTSIFVIEYCLLKLWESWGIKPDYVLGHSTGEFCAAVASGILSFEDALKLMAERTRLIDNLAQGSMLVIRATVDQVEKLMKQKNVDLDIAAVNTEDQTVVAGDTSKVEQFLGICKEEGLKGIILEATHAFHSRHMDPMLATYRKVAESVKVSKKASCGYISGVEGKLLENPLSQMNAEYWVRHTRQKVNFVEACKTLKQLECEDYLEIGAQPVLSSFVMQNIEGLSISCYPSLRRNTNDWETILTSLGKMYLQGYKIDWEYFDKPYDRKRTPNLPLHPFYRKQHWVEGQLPKTTIIHPLLGQYLSNATSQNIFQNDLSIKLYPYLKDHCIGSLTIFPGAGFTEMLLTAGYCVSNTLTEDLEKPTQAIAVENVKIETPLELKKDKACRMQTVVSYNGSEGFECRVYHQNQNEEAEKSGSSRDWMHHASAKFQPFASVTSLMEQWNGSKVSDMISTSEPVSGEGFYKSVSGTGLKFGDQFQTIQQYWSFEGELVVAMNCPSEHEKYLLHPLLIDTMIQTAVLLEFSKGSEKPSLRVPVRIGKLTLLPGGLDQEDESKLYLYAKQEPTGKVVIFVCCSKFLPIAIMEDVELIETSVKAIEGTLQQQRSKIPDSWEEVWKQAPGPLDSRLTLDTLEFTLNNLFSEKELVKGWQQIDSTITEDDSVNIRKVNRLIYLLTLRSFKQLGWEPKVGENLDVDTFCQAYGIQANFKQLIFYYFTMFEDFTDLVKVTKQEQTVWKVISVNSDLVQIIDHEWVQLYQELRQTERFSVVAGIYRYVGQLLAKIFRGEMSPLSVLYPVEATSEKLTAEAYLSDHPGNDVLINKVDLILKGLTSHFMKQNDPSKRKFRILEVGAGTGAMARTVLKDFLDFWGTNFEYYFTDISSGYFGKAEKKFSESYKGNLKYATFNIEEPPLDQGIPVNYFDLVVGSDVLHATKDLKECLRNIRQTLRPEGVLYCIDTFSFTIYRGITFVFGLLEGYWRFQDFDVRPHHCCVEGQTWSKILLESGFKDVRPIDMYCGYRGAVAAVASQVDGWTIPGSVPVVKQSKTWLLFYSEKDYVSESLTTALRNNSKNVRLVLPEREVLKCETKTETWMNQIFGEFETGDGGQLQGIIYAWDKVGSPARDQREVALPYLYIAKRLLKMEKAPKLIVLNRAVHGITDNLVGMNPAGATLIGMTTSLKNENANLFVRCVDLESDSGSGVVDQILYELAISMETRVSHGVQVAYRENVKYTPKLTRGTLAENPRRLDLQLPPCAERYQLRLPESKVIDDLRFVPMEPEPMGENQVEVKVLAYALNFRDIMGVLKPTKAFDNMDVVGAEFSGVINKVGSAVKPEDLKLGDTVVGIKYNHNLFQSYVVQDVWNVVKTPDWMSVTEGATVPTVFTTVIQCLINVAKMKKGDWVLVHTASGGVGLAAIQMVRKFEANLICTAGSPRKRAYLRSLGVQHVFHSRDTSYLENIMRVTNGRGVDIVLNSITGPGMKEASLAACAPNARFVEMSKMNIWTVEDVKQLRPDVQYSVEDLMASNVEQQTDFNRQLTSYISEPYYRPIPYVLYDALRVRQALKHLQKGMHIGKVVVRLPETKVVNGQWTVNILLFNAKSTYIITGGLGGIGFVVCKWMLERGANDIVLVGRNPPKPEMAKEIEQWNEKGYNVMVMLADVGDAVECKALFEEIKATCKKPIRGIQHCAGVLSDNVYENQKWPDFEHTFRPKVKGTWNLHVLTRELPMEHFVVYSSTSALLGPPGQSNHAAANCFEDAFTHYRHAMGLCGTSINWGQWGQVGVAREMNLMRIFAVNYKRMLNGLEEALRANTRQVAFAEFDKALGTTFPALKNYVDEKSFGGDKGQMGSAQGNKEQFWKEMDATDIKEEKQEIVAIYLKRILRDALRMEVDEEIGHDVHLGDLGVDSLILLELRNSIQSLVGSRVNVTANMLKDCNTIRELSNAILKEIYEEGSESVDPTSEEHLAPDELTELLQKDINLEESIQPPTKPEKLSQIKRVLVTGSSGQVGPYLISALSRIAPNLEKIICLVRSRRDGSSEEILENALKSMNLLDKVDIGKVQCIRGNVTLPSFGLKPEEYAELANSVDIIFHLAIKSNHVEAYKKSEKDFNGTDVRSVNVGGLLNVLRFASTGKTKHIYYPSSWSIAFTADVKNGHLHETWPKSSQIKTLVETRIMGYVIAKWVGEMLLKQATERGIPCKVFRFAHMLGDSQTGQLNYRHNHYILRFISYMKIKAMPDYTAPALSLPVDICVDTSVKLFWREDVPNSVYNIVHPYPQLEVEFVQVAKQIYGLDVEIVDTLGGDFMERITASGMPLEALGPVYADLERAKNIASFPAVLGYLSDPDTFCESQKLKQLLPEFLETVPKPMDIIKKSLEYVKAEGFMEKFGV